ncbi:hypothetical protein [Chamaesiphon sp.]|uniref:hypothetical protein n=1 Tax=Chamaesiphon sp. TaxID=2814140 RepID=UPI00359365D2
MLKYLLLSLAIGSLNILPNRAVAISSDRPIDRNTSEVEAKLPSAHPTAYYLYAQKLYQAGRRDDAVFWFYVGQLRYRFHLSANPNLPQDGDPAIFASLNATLGQEINEYAGGDPVTWVAAIDRALKWDLNSPNYFTSKQQFNPKYTAIRTGLMELKQTIQAQAEEIRLQRSKIGLPNRR